MEEGNCARNRCGSRLLLLDRNMLIASLKRASRAPEQNNTSCLDEVVHFEQHFAVFLKERQIDFGMAESPLKDFFRSPKFLF